MDCANEKVVRKFKLRFGSEERAAALGELRRKRITGDLLFPALPALEAVAQALDGIDARHLTMHVHDSVDVSDSVAITLTTPDAPKLQ